MSLSKERVSITLSKPYRDFMDRLVENGMYFTKASVVMDALRLLSEQHMIPILYLETE